MIDNRLKERLSVQLAARKEQLQTEIRDKLAAAREVIGTGLIDQLIEAGDSAVADFIADLDLAEVKRDLAELRAIEAAQKHMAEGTYGTCMDCGGVIPIARLEVFPTASRCVACQSQYEARYGAPHTKL